MMKIINLTPFDSTQLRAIAQHVAENELDPEHRNGITIHFVTSKAKNMAAQQARIQGYDRRAHGLVPQGLKFNQAIVKIPRKRTIVKPKHYAQQTALLLAHEFAEMRGCSHTVMRGPRYFFRDNWKEIYSWAESFPLQLKAKPITLPVDKFNEKLANALKRKRNAQTRAKRANTILRKWDRKVQYYEKQIAARSVGVCL